MRREKKSVHFGSMCMQHFIRPGRLNAVPWTQPVLVSARDRSSCEQWRTADRLCCISNDVDVEKKNHKTKQTNNKSLKKKIKKKKPVRGQRLIAIVEFELTRMGFPN